MDEEEEQFVSIDLNDEDICSICKLDTETGTLSFCHVCFELSIEGVTAALPHSTSSRGHRHCFEKFHLIADQKPSRARHPHHAHGDLRRALSQHLGRVVRYARDREPGTGHARPKLAPHPGTQVPRYAPRWVAEACGGGGAGQPDPPRDSPWSREQKGGTRRVGRHAQHSQEELLNMNVDELHQLNSQLLLQVQKVFEELSVAVQEKDSLASQLHVRHVAIEQLFKNCDKLPWLQMGRAGVRTSNAPVE